MIDRSVPFRLSDGFQKTVLDKLLHPKRKPGISDSQLRASENLPDQNRLMERILHPVQFRPEQIVVERLGNADQVSGNHRPKRCILFLKLLDLSLPVRDDSIQFALLFILQVLGV